MSADYSGKLMALFLIYDPEEFERSIHEVRETVPRALAADCERCVKDQAVKEQSKFPESS